MVTDKGIVIKDIKHNVYYCGMNTWDKQLRKAKIYHSEKYAQSVIDTYKDEELKFVSVVISETL